MLKGKYVSWFLRPALQAVNSSISDVEYFFLPNGEEVVVITYGDAPRFIHYQGVSVTATSNEGILKSVPNRLSSRDKWWLSADEYREMKETNVGDKEG